MALGAVSSGIGLLYLSSWTVFRTRQGQDPSLDWGAAIGVFAFALCGGTTGAIAGLVAALRVIARRESEPWRPPVWLGVATGLAVGLGIAFSGVPDRRYPPGNLLEFWAGTAVFAAASGTLGGLLGNAAGDLRAVRRTMRRE